MMKKILSWFWYQATDLTKAYLAKEMQKSYRNELKLRFDKGYNKQVQNLIDKDKTGDLEKYHKELMSVH